MGYKFTINEGWKVKVDGKYPWPCKQYPDRMIELFTDDVLTQDATTKLYTVHTGVCCFGIVLNDDQVEPIGKPSHLQLI